MITKLLKKLDWIEKNINLQLNIQLRIALVDVQQEMVNNLENYTPEDGSRLRKRISEISKLLQK